MKSIIILNLGFVLFSQLSLNCTKENRHNNILINKNVISQILSMPENEQKTAYRLLNNFEMANLWQNKLYSIKRNEILSPEQEDFINGLVQLLKPDLFIINSKTNKEFRSTTGKILSESAVRLFGTDNAKALLVSLNNKSFNKRFHTNISSEDDEEEEGAEGGVGKCKCSTESNYCDPLAICDEQPETICRHTTFGCGAFLLYSCNGKCRQ